MPTPQDQQPLTEHFRQYISDHKKEFIERVLLQRTRHITIVMEDIYQSQNASAVVRTCECMGLQEVHFIENISKYSVNPKVLKGANKWIDLVRHKEKKVDNTEACFRSLRQRGYRILVTDPSADGVSIHDVGIDRKLAIVMGNELKGISRYALENADGRINIPMFGFTESMNISVSAAICIHTLVAKLRSSSVDWSLSEAEKNELRLIWYKKVVRNAELIEREFFLRSVKRG